MTPTVGRGVLPEVKRTSAVSVTFSTQQSPGKAATFSRKNVFGYYMQHSKQLKFIVREHLNAFLNTSYSMIDTGVGTW